MERKGRTYGGDGARADHEKEILIMSKCVQIQLSQFVQSSLALLQNSLEICSFLKNKKRYQLSFYFCFEIFISFKEAKGLVLFNKEESLVPPRQSGRFQ